MAKFGLQQRMEQMYYKHGLFMSNHPVIMICISAVAMLCCCYPLLNLPLPGSEPTEFSTPSSDFSDRIYTAGKELPYDHLDVPVKLPPWFQGGQQVAYVQQFIVKSTVNPWDEKEMIPIDAYRAPLAKIFTLLEEIENFHLEEDESHSVTKQCLHVTESIIKPKQSIKPLFPEYTCLVLSPASFWKNSAQNFQNDPNIIHAIHKYQGKTIEASPSIKELLFGVPSKESGVNNFIVRNRQRVVSYAITLVLKSYDRRMISALKGKLQDLHPIKMDPRAERKCKDGTNCENSSDSSGESVVVPAITHIHFKPQIGSNELIPLLSTYFIMGCYIYFSVKKINFVKSKLGMAFSAVVSIMASLMMSVGLCSLFGLKPTLNGGEIFPYLVIIIGLENILVITKSVVATPIHLEVDRRIALGLSREGCSISKNLLLELILIGLGYFTYVPEIQEFCAFAVVGILSDYFMHMIFFTTVLSIDIRRLDITEDLYSQSRGSDSEEEYVRTNEREETRNLRHGYFERKRSSISPTEHKRKRSVLEQLRASNRNKRKSDTDEIHKVETGGKSVTILKIPKRLRVLFFWADTRMVQRGLMVCMVIWFALLMYGDPFGSKSTVPASQSSLRYRTATLPPIPPLTKEAYSLFKEEQKTPMPEPVDTNGNLLWSHNDLMLYRRLSFRHWPTLFAYYNLTLAGRFVSILPPIPLTITIPPVEAVKTRHVSETLKQNDPSSTEPLLNEEHLALYSYTGRYPMTGLDYYLTLLVGAVSGMLMVFLLTVMYRCICTRNYANWRTSGRRRRRPGTVKYKSSIGDTMPLVLSGHPQLVECIVCNDGLLASTDLSGELRVWDIHTGECNRVIHRVEVPVPQRGPAEGAIDAKPTPVGYQEDDHLKSSVFVNPYQPPMDPQDFNIATSMQRSADFYIESGEGSAKKGHTRQRSWHATPKSRRTHHRSGSGSNIIPNPNQTTPPLPSFSQQPSQPRFLSFGQELDFSGMIQTNFVEQAKEKTAVRKRTEATKNWYRPSSQNSNQAEILKTPETSGLLGFAKDYEFQKGDYRPKRKTSDETLRKGYEKGNAGYDFEGVFRDYCDQFDLDSDVACLGNLSRRLRQDNSLQHKTLTESKSAPNTAYQYPLQSQRYCLQATSACGFPRSETPAQQGLVNQREISGRYSSSSSPFDPDQSLSCENINNLWGSWESGLGGTTPVSGLGSWNSSPGSPVEMENGPAVWCMVSVRDVIVTGCENGRIEVWDGKSGMLKCTHDVGRAGLIGLAAEDKKLVAARVNGSLDFFAMEVTNFQSPPVQYRGITRVRITRYDLEDLSYSDVLTLQLLYTVKCAHQQPITAFKMAMGRVLTGSSDHTLKLFTAQDAQCLFTLYGHKEPISTLYMDQGPPAGAVSGSSDGTVRLWDLPSGRCLHMLDEHKGEVTSVQCSNTHIVSIAQDDQLCIWTRNGILLHVRCLDAGCFSDMCLLGSTWCVTGGIGHVQLWDMRNGELVRKIKLSDEPSGLASRVSKLVPVANLAVACDTGKELQIVRFPSVLEKID